MPSARKNYVVGFTLIEIMVVVAIIGLVCAMGMPSIIKALQKDGMRKAVSDFSEVCKDARGFAIVHKQKTAVIIHPAKDSFSVDGAAEDKTLPDGIKFAMLDIFRQDYLESDWAKIFFYPDGTCDETVVVFLGHGDSEKITLDYATGTPIVSDVRQ